MVTGNLSNFARIELSRYGNPDYCSRYPGPGSWNSNGYCYRLMVIRGYYLSGIKDHSFSIPKGAAFLTLVDSGNHPELVFLVEPEGITELRTFIIVNYMKPTVPEDAEYMGMFISNGKYNLVFEVEKNDS